MLLVIIVENPLSKIVTRIIIYGFLILFSDFYLNFFNRIDGYAQFRALLPRKT